MRISIDHRKRAGQRLQQLGIPRSRVGLAVESDRFDGRLNGTVSAITSFGSGEKVNVKR